MLGLFLASCSTDPTWDHRDGLNPGLAYAPNTPRPIPEPRVKPPVPAEANPTYAAVPSSGVVTVKKGDTVYALSRRYGVPIEEIVSANNLRPPYTLSIGQRLKLPTARRYTVRKGDTGYSIARRYGLDVSELMRVNRIRPPYTLAVGQQLRLPAPVRPPDPDYVSPLAAKYAGAGGSARPRPDTPAPPPRTGGTFSWPVVGRVISRFGPKEGGLHNDGINIAVPESTPVKAAESGVVAYAGDELRGFGNLLLIRHDGGWVTAYAHNETILVQRGQKVRRGQVVARAGDTGSVRTPQVHFEVRKGSTPVDPESYLDSQAASLN